MKILHVPNPILKKKSSDVTSLDNNLITFVEQLEDTLRNKKNPEGVGLSAPQVGKNINIFSTYLGDGPLRSIKTYINPKIVKASKKLTLGKNPKRPFMEGCLSIPEVYGPVWRHKKITIDYYIFDDNKKTLVQKSESHSDFPARVIQHEYDHLNGILFTERAIEQNLPLYQEIDGQLVEVQV